MHFHLVAYWLVLTFYFMLFSYLFNLYCFILKALEVTYKDKIRFYYKVSHDVFSY